MFHVLMVNIYVHYFTFSISKSLKHKPLKSLLPFVALRKGKTIYIPTKWKHLI